MLYVGSILADLSFIYFIMRKILSFFLLASLPISIFALGRDRTPAQVISIVDWDTVKVSMSWIIDTVRILGIDTPEKYITRTWNAECYWEEASQYAIMSLSGKTIELESDSRQKWRDIYDRKLAHIWVDGTLYWENAIKLGYAFRYTAKSTKYQKIFINAEKEAKKSKLGVWTVCGGKRIPLVSTWGVSKPAKSLTTTDTMLPSGSWSWAFSCSVKRTYCSQIKTREEAQFYLNQCGKKQFDRDNDWIACEEIK